LVKRVFSIFMLLIFLFNGIGYYGLVYLTRKHLQADMLLKLDAGNYADSQTLTLKIPLSLPYTLNANADYERTNGNFQYQGEFYKLVKQKLSNDTLYIVCIRDGEEKRLNTVVTDFIKITHALPASSKALKLLHFFIKDFEPGSSTVLEVSSRLIVSTAFQAGRHYVVLKAAYTISTPPPRALP
jgi:hypothetical protein